jgi:hypothetical protein
MIQIAPQKAKSWAWFIGLPIGISITLIAAWIGYDLYQTHMEKVRLIEFIRERSAIQRNVRAVNQYMKLKLPKARNVEINGYPLDVLDKSGNAGFLYRITFMIGTAGVGGQQKRMDQKTAYALMVDGRVVGHQICPSLDQVNICTVQPHP